MAAGVTNATPREQEEAQKEVQLVNGKINSAFLYGSAYTIALISGFSALIALLALFYW